MRLWSVILFACVITSAVTAFAETGSKPIDRLMQIEREDDLGESLTFVFMMQWQIALLAEKLDRPEAASAAYAVLRDEARTWRAAIEPVAEQGVRERLSKTFDEAKLQVIAAYYDSADVAARREALRKFRAQPRSLTPEEVRLAFDRDPDPPLIIEYRATLGQAAVATMRQPAFCEREKAFRDRVRQRLHQSVFDAIAPKKSCADIVTKASD